MADRQVCVNCGKANPEDTGYCFACGHILPYGMRKLSTRGLDVKSGLQPQIRWGTAFFGDQTLLEIHIQSTGTTIEEPCGMACVIGRAAGDSRPDIDLSPFGALELGVSRRHAMFTRRSATIMVQDLDSINGTYLNGERLVPKQARVLRNQDELTLGQLTLQVSFRKVTAPLEISPTENEDDVVRLISAEDRAKLSPPQTAEILPSRVNDLAKHALPAAGLVEPPDAAASPDEPEAVPVEFASVEPVIEDPVMEAPVNGEPATDDPIPREPVIDEPVIDEPKPAVPERVLLLDKLLHKPVPAEPEDAAGGKSTKQESPRKLQPKAPPVPAAPGLRPVQTPPAASKGPKGLKGPQAKPEAMPPAKGPRRADRGKEMAEGPSQHVVPAAKPGTDELKPANGVVSKSRSDETIAQADGKPEAKPDDSQPVRLPRDPSQEAPAE